ncbi:ATP-binding protein [Caulobacter sp. 1776]|uniref:sensor histidine kinase n=1 Tax=Caulobacter sp. 1776 TaxID=3156420 RepID=UPI00339B1109
MPKSPDHHASTAELAVSQTPVQDGREARRAPWLAYANLKLEAAIFLLLAVTFAAVLGKGAITTQTLDLTSDSGRFAGFTFSDADDGGRSAISADPKRPLSWSCRIREGVTYPYCGYGLQLDTVGKTGKVEGLNFTPLQTITLRFTYHGTGDRLRLLVRSAPPPALRGKLKDQFVPLATDFPVVRGRNTVRLPLAQLAPEQWWIASHGLSPEEAAPVLDEVHVVAITSSNAKPPSDMAVSVDAITLEGSHLSSEHFYLIILGAWLVVTGAFLAYRVLRMRRDYETRQRHQANEARLLASAHAAAAAASSAKSRFLGNMSHELRTPLNAVLGYAYWLNRTSLDPKQRDAVGAIQSSGEHLLAMISDILDIAKIEAGKFELLAAPLDLEDCVTGVGEMFRLPAQEKGLDFVVEFAPDLPASVVADRKRLRQVLINLVGNAIKFTARGEVALRVQRVTPRTASDGETTRLRFVVEDTGVGIAADQVDTIFRPFEQAGDQESRGGGAGLGLSITRQIVEMMDGDLAVESQPGRGSRFTVEATFPLAPDIAAPAPPRLAPTRLAQGAGRSSTFG